MTGVFGKLLLVTVLLAVKGQELEDFGSDEVMIAQESRQFQTAVKPTIKIVKPTGDTNSHRPQFNQASMEIEGLKDVLETSTNKNLVRNYKSSSQIRSKEGMVNEAVLKALESKDHVGKLVEMLPIIRAMTESQKMALTSLVASQISSSPENKHMSLSQVRSMFGNDVNTTSDITLPILLDMVNLINPPKKDNAPQTQMLRRFDDGDMYFEDEIDDSPFVVNPTKDTSKHRTRRIPQKTQAANVTSTDKTEHNNTAKLTHNTKGRALYSSVKREGDNRTTPKPPSTTRSTTASTTANASSISSQNSSLTTLDLIADSTNNSLAQDLPVAEKLRALTRYTSDRKGLYRRGTYPKSPAVAIVRRTTAEPSLSTLRRRPIPARKLPIPGADTAKCELFTNTLCLSADDYPTEAIVQSIYRNKAAAGALLADFKDPGEGALDGITAAQEAKYTSENSIMSNRRGDTANRDFASAGEAGFMCTSTVKYARPQRARATSGQWKYIVNTGEHTQTLRLEKCLKPKESCTYLTDNFKSKCVQVYNYHRLLTWDQQNGLHMDIFKVPTCCSCHIEGYSVSFPPLGHRIQDISSETFPGEDVSAEHGNHAFETVQSTIQRPSLNKSPFTHTKPSESFPSFSDTQNFIPGQPFSKFTEEEINAHLSPVDSYGNTYFPDSFNQASSIKNVKRPPARNFISSNHDSITLPSYLEPPTPSATSTFVKDSHKYKNVNSLQRGPNRNRRPIRKKISGGLDDLASSGTLTVESFTSSIFDSTEDQNNFMEEPEIGQASIPNMHKQRITIAPKLYAITTEKLTTQKPAESEESLNNGKKINYNYHPIIDFFGEGDKNDSLDREDSDASYIATLNSEWHPLNHPPSTNVQSLLRKSQK
ncbi:hypothetical protein K1T71_004769 [Dendrolimus kikuchii]|uniref:Uncharacterized protein n=1 Tax=Dendrolimus kikuchii TaxID=765133 RepID=A0ACC1D9B8_9NEOP|nr:hypothetical protein K1T71_004769 [Dendrolimus kikuchii]